MGLRDRGIDSDRRLMASARVRIASAAINAPYKTCLPKRGTDTADQSLFN